MWWSTFRRLRLPPGNVSAERDDSYGSPKIYCAAVELGDITFRRLRLTQENISAGMDEKYDSTRIDSAAVELNDLFAAGSVSRRRNLPRMPVAQYSSISRFPP